MDYMKIYEEWTTNPFFSEETRQELLAIKDDEKEIKERFYADLEFGTAGLRGIIGAGINRMNNYVVAKATQGLANYILHRKKQAKGVAICFDSRRCSPEFADVAALCLAANGIKAYVFESLRPTPELSFAVRELGCVAGINITASHNPPEYNGYKVYWEDGAQITPPHDAGIMKEVKSITVQDAKTMPKLEAIHEGLYEIIGKEIDDSYMAALKKQIIHQDCIDRYGSEIKVVYTPLHGTGNIPARRILREIGFENVYVVPEQELPDGDFPTVSYPNPEAAEAFELALKLAKERNADLVLATDPDADRLGVYVKDKQGEYHCLTGNMSGSLLAEYELSQRAATKGLPEDGVLIKTIVTTNFADAIAKHYGVKVIETLTGFKYIGQQILNFETKGEGTYLFGFEESYGCLIGTHARDKDAIVATMALCEAAAYYRSKDMTLWDVMIDMYDRYGYYLDGIETLTLKGIDGKEKITSIMDHLKAHTPEQVAGYKVLWARNYDNDTATNMINKAVLPTGLPKSNVVYYDLEGGAWLCVRPSGTEPKIKFYYGIVGESIENAHELADKFGQEVLKMIEHLL
ncbi:MAG: phospho-sugar mutase [Lachnospiraceae bacterium]|nr:phospho-sugar mutase [Lachnospiraceae bacterium]